MVKDGYLVSSGDTILAADDKAGIATIMEAYDYVKENNIPHREMYFLFTICEELNMMGIKNFDFSKLPTKNIYVIDSAGSPGVMTMKNPAKAVSYTHLLSPRYFFFTTAWPRCFPLSGGCPALWRSAPSSP